MGKKSRQKKDRRAFVATQPRDGETVLHCGHALDADKVHFTGTSKGHAVEFRAPDGTVGMSNWLVECDACFRTRAGTDRFNINSHMTWKGNAPVVRVPFQSDLSVVRNAPSNN